MANAGRKSDRSHVPADGHGCPSCPHSARGPASTGSSNVLVNGKPALRVGDKGYHRGCCGNEKWVAVQGAARVLINDRPAHRLGDEDAHCGGGGHLMEGSPDVLIGDHTGGGTHDAEQWVGVMVVDAFGRAIPNLHFRVTGPLSFEGKTAGAAVKQIKVPRGEYELHVDGVPSLRPAHSASDRGRQ